MAADQSTPVHLPVHLPVLRAGRPYRSLETVTLTHLVTGEPVARVSQANPGLIARDLARAEDNRRALAGRSVAELIEISARAAELFVSGDLPLGDAGDDDPTLQSADDYVRQLSATTGMPEALARGNMGKIHHVLSEMPTVLAGLTRGLDLEILDRGWGLVDGRPVSFRREADVLGAVLPSNSPGVHSLWLPAIPLKTTLALKPGRQEPWTPHRVAQAFLAAGAPPEAFGVYPTGYPGAGEILQRSGRSLLFGDRSTVGAWAGDPRIQLHGPGWSKVILGPDRADDYESFLDVLAASVADNGGRSCINASGVWTTRHGRRLAEALAERLAAIDAHPLDHPEARLAAFPSRAAAQAVSDFIDARLADGGAVDLTAEARRARSSGTGGRSPSRVAEAGGAFFVLPTVVWCESPDHPLAHTELLLPFVSVVETSADEMVDQMGESLVVSALTEDPQLTARLLAAPTIERLNLGAYPTSRVDWDQPHEGNLFQHLYRQRAFHSPQLAAAQQEMAQQAAATTAGAPA